MAKTSSVEKNNRRAKMAKQYAGKRAKLKAMAVDDKLSPEDRFGARLKLRLMLMFGLMNIAIGIIPGTTTILGAPLLRGGRAIGVLVVQNRAERRYDEDEVEDIQTIAMVLAETVASGELLGQDELRDIEVAPHRPERLKGAKFADGLAFRAEAEALQHGAVQDANELVWLDRAEAHAQARKFDPSNYLGLRLAPDKQDKLRLNRGLIISRQLNHGLI